VRTFDEIQNDVGTRGRFSCPSVLPMGIISEEKRTGTKEPSDCVKTIPQKREKLG